MEIAICGGGIGGLVLAHALSKHTHLRISVYEANPQLSGSGTGLGIFRRTMLILQDLGLGEAMEELCGPMSNEDELILLMRKSSGDYGQTIAKISSPGGMKGAHRTAFHDVLIAGLRQRRNVLLSTSKRVTSYEEQHNRVTVHFLDGGAVECDVVVGADGLRSAVRTSMVKALTGPQMGSARHFPLFQERIIRIVEGRAVEGSGENPYTVQDLATYQGAVWSGYLVYRAVIPRGRLEARNPNHRLFDTTMINYSGKDKFIVAFSIARGTTVNVSLYVFDPAGAAARKPYLGKSIKDVDVNEVVSQFGSDWEPEVIDLLSCLEGLQMNCWAVSTVEGLPSYSHGRATLLGDAAHAMLPSLGMGAGQSIEDAYVLAALLSHPKALPNIEAALSSYSHIRRPFVNDVIQLAHRNQAYFAHRGENLLALEIIPEDPTSSRDGQGEYLESIRAQAPAVLPERLTLEEVGSRTAQTFLWVGDGAEELPKRAVEIFERMITAES